MKRHQNLPHNASSAWWEKAPPPPQPLGPQCPLGGRVTEEGAMNPRSHGRPFCFRLPSTGAAVSTPVVGEVQQSSQVTGRGDKPSSSHPPCPLEGARGSVPPPPPPPRPVRPSRLHILKSLSSIGPFARNKRL